MPVYRFDDSLAEQKELYNKLLANKKFQEDSLRETQSKLKSLRESREKHLFARELLNQVALLCQERVVTAIESLVTQALEAVFGIGYSFRIESKIARNQPEMYFYVVVDGEEYSVKDELGGGVIDLISFALRIVLWSLSVPRTRPVIILDEPGKFISRDKQELFGEMLVKLSEMLGLQFIVITHEDVICGVADKAYIVEKKGSISYVRET